MVKPKEEKTHDIHDDEWRKATGNERKDSRGRLIGARKNNKRPKGTAEKIDSEVKKRQKSFRKNISITPMHNAKFDALGGSTWLAMMLDSIDVMEIPQLRTPRRRGLQKRVAPKIEIKITWPDSMPKPAKSPQMPREILDHLVPTGMPLSSDKPNRNLVDPPTKNYQGKPVPDDYFDTSE